MHNIIRYTLIALLAAWFGPAMAQPDPAMVEKVAAMLESVEAKAEPKAPRKVLVVTICKGYRHSSIPIAAEAFKMMGEKTGAYEATISEDPAMFLPENLNQFDALVFDNTTGTLFEDQVLKDSLMAFSKSGKGVMGFHAATDCFYDWPDYGAMMGGYFNGHPWNADETVGIRIDDPGNLLCECFKGRNFRLQDEIYQFKEPYSRDKLRVLLSLDPAHTDFNKGDSLRREDNDYAIAWVKHWGEGRVFYSSLGHNEHVFWHPKVMQFYLNGLQYVLGDLEGVDTAPSSELTDELIAESIAAGKAMLIGGMVEDIAAYTYGKDAAVLEEMQAMILAAQGDTDQSARLEAAMLAVLETPGATHAGKTFACRMLYLVGTEASIPILSSMLADTATNDIARYALERIHTEAAAAALLNALEGSKGAAAIGLINSLGQRAYAPAVSALETAATGDDTAVAQAGIVALGNIGTPEAADALSALRDTAAPPLKKEIEMALLDCAAVLAESDTPKVAAKLYESLYKNADTQAVRAGAIRGLIALSAVKRFSVLEKALQNENALVRNAAGEAMRYTQDSDFAAQVARALPKWPAEAQLLAIPALADRGAVEALPAITEAATSEVEAVQLAAIEALGVLGDASTAVTLAEIAAGNEGEVKTAARSALTALNEDGVDALMLARIPEADLAVKTELLRALGERGAVESTATLLGMAAEEMPAVRKEVFRALGLLANAEHLEALLALLIAESDAAVQTLAERAVVNAAQATGAAPVLAVYEDTENNTAARMALIRVLGKLEDDSAMDTIYASLTHGKGDVQALALETLSRWASPTPAPKLLAFANAAPTEELRAQALHGALLLLSKPSERTAAQSVTLYKQAMSLTRNNDEKALVLRGVAVVPDPAAMALIKTCDGITGLERDVREALEQAAVVAYTEKDIFAVLQSEAMACDGKLDDWRRFSTPIKGNGVDAYFRITWTAEALWIAVEAFDRSHETGGDPRAMAQRDCVLIGVDPLNQDCACFDDNTLEMGVEFLEDGGLVNAWHFPQEAEYTLLDSVQTGLSRDGNITTYEIAIPWGMLAPFAVETDTAFGLNIVVCDKDKGRDATFEQWAGGILTGDNVSKFSTLMLVGEL